jgi:hypothetical protein
MSELYPKVVNVFINEESNRDKNAAKNKRELAIFITVSILLTMIYVLFTGQNSSEIEEITGGIVAGGIVGAMLFGAKKLFEVIFFMGKNMRGGGGTGSTLFYANKIKRHDPEFSIEYFRDKITSLFRMAVYSKDATELACCKCQCPEKAADIIEAQLFNFNINSCKIKDMVCDVEVTLFLDCLHYRKGKIQSKTDKYRMRIRKHIKAPTELGFSFSAVSCPSCGGSFDARNVKACPYCGNEYLHEEHDWVITNIK